MTTFHVTTDGSNANNGLTKATAFRSLSYAFSQALTNDDILLYYNALVPYEFTEGAELTVSKNINIYGVSSNDVAASDVVANLENTTWIKDERPTVLWTGSFAGRCIEPQTGFDLVIRGVNLHGSGTAWNCISNTATNGNIFAYDCRFEGVDPTLSIGYPIGATESGDEIHRCLLIGGEHNISLGDGCSISFSILSGSADDPILMGHGSNVAVIENCLIIYGNEDGGTLTGPIGLGGAGQRITNCLAYNNQTEYGWDLNANVSASYVASWTTNSASFHTQGPFRGVPTANDITADPMFLDVGSGDYRLADSSELLTAGTSVGITGTLTYDLQALTSQYPIGPFIGAPVVPLWAFQEGSGSSVKITPDFIFNTVQSRKGDYNRQVDAIPFGMTTPGPISLRKRSIPYRLTK